MKQQPATPGQTVGPFFHLGLNFPGDADLVSPEADAAQRLYGTVFDGAGDPVPDALIEVWQTRPDAVRPDASGSFRRGGETFTGWGRAASDVDGGYAFTTLAPGVAAGAARFFALTIFARGLLHRVQTRAYLPEPAAALSADTLLARLPAERRATLLATTTADGWHFDIRLQGEHETVFLTPADA